MDKIILIKILFLVTTTFCKAQEITLIQGKHVYVQHSLTRSNCWDCNSILFQIYNIHSLIESIDNQGNSYLIEPTSSINFVYSIFEEFMPQEVERSCRESYGEGWQSRCNNCHLTVEYGNAFDAPLGVQQETNLRNIFDNLRMSNSCGILNYSRVVVNDDTPIKVGLYQYKAPTIFEELNEEYYWVLTSIEGIETIIATSHDLLLKDIAEIYSIRAASKHFKSKPFIINGRTTKLLTAK